MFISSGLITYTVVYYAPWPFQPLPHPLEPLPLPPPTYFFSCVHGYWVLFIYLLTLCTYHYYLCFFASIQCIAPWQCRQKMMRGDFFLEDTMKFNSFWVSVFFYVYFICFSYMYGSVLWPLAPFTLTPPPLFSFFQLCMGIIHLFMLYPLYILIISIFAFSGVYSTLPRGNVSKRWREANFFRRYDEDQRLLGKCIFVCLFYLLQLHVW